MPSDKNQQLTKRNKSRRLLTFDFFDFWSSFMILSRRFSVNRALPLRNKTKGKIKKTPFGLLVV